jgi:heme exporter protein C
MSPNHDVRSDASRRLPAVQSPRARWTVRIIGIGAVVGVVLTVWLGLWVTPPDQVQGNLVRLVYIHPGVAWVALYLAFGLAALASLLYLWPRTRSLFWDRLAAAAVEVGVVFNICTLISGSIWGKPTWGVYWAWDARLTSTAVLLVLFLGYMALRRVPAEPETRAKRSAFVALFASVDVPIVHFSVLWWKTLHQGATVLNPDLSPTIHGSMAWTLLLSFVALTLVFLWMLLVRYRIGVMEDWLGGGELDLALLERQAEGAGPQPLPIHPEVEPVAEPVAEPVVEPVAVTTTGAVHGADAGDGAGLPPVPESAR